VKTVVIGTRGSPLALAQAEIISRLLTAADPEVIADTKIIKTAGDQFHNLSLTAGVGKGLFTKEIEERLLRGEVHVAVHSMKDLPTALPDALTIGAVPKREDARDVLVAKDAVSLDQLPAGATVATSSIRRKAQLLAHRPDLHVVEIRGNVETRLRKLVEDDSLDAIVLAAAGLNRLGLWEKFGQLLWHEMEHDVMIPAVGQGAIACEVRQKDFETQELLAKINDADAQACVEAERAFLRAMGGGCQVPYAAHATIDGEDISMVAARFEPAMKRAEVAGLKTESRELGERAARQLLAL
jgi:hydroxymethylbilane synthase